MARLTTKRRDSLPSKSFAVPSKRAYPITDPAHARAALSRVSANGTPAEKAAVKRAVAKKFPSIDVGGKRKAKGRKKK